MNTEIRSVIKAVNILELFSRNNDGLTWGDITASLDYPSSTLNNLISTLAIHDFLKKQGTKRGKYYLGKRFLDIAGSIKSDPGDALTVSYLIELSKLVNETVYLEVWYGSEVLAAKAADYFNNPPNVSSEDWFTKPLYVTCTGKIIMANLSDQELDKYFRHLENLTSNSIMDVDQLRAEISEIRREGVAHNNEKYIPGMNGIAAGIKNSQGETIGSVFIIGSSLRLTDAKLRKITLSVKACAMKISQALGFKDSDSRETISKEIEATIIVQEAESKRTPPPHFIQRTKFVNSVVKAMDILELFSGKIDGLALGEIAASLHMNESTASHLVSTLTAYGFLKQTMKKGKYYLGVRFLDIAGSIKSEREDELTVSYLMEMSRLVNDSACLEVWYGSDVLLSKASDYYNGPPNLKPVDWFTMPLYSTCVGKIILANLSDDDLEKFFRFRHLEKPTPNTITDIEQLKVQLLDIKREGVAYEKEEGISGMNGIAAGIKNSEGETIGSVFIMGSSVRLTTAKLKKITPVVKASAMRISSVLRPDHSQNELSKTTVVH